MQKKQYAGILIILLAIPTVVLLGAIASMQIVYSLAVFEIIIGVSVLRIKNEKLDRKKFWFLILLLMILGLLTLAAAFSFPIWARLFVK